MNSKEQFNLAAKGAAEEIPYHMGIHSGHAKLQVEIGEIITKHMQPLLTRMEEAEREVIAQRQSVEHWIGTSPPPKSCESGETNDSANEKGSK